jgi:hypothetical protein
MNDLITQMLAALAADEIWLAWCRDNLGAMPRVVYEPKLPTRAIPDVMYPFVFLYALRQTGPVAASLEIGVGLRDADTAWSSEDRNPVVHGAAQTVTVEVCQAQLRASAMFHEAVSALYRAKLGSVNLDGETGTVNLDPYFEAYGAFSASLPPSTRKPLGR